MIGCFRGPLQGVEIHSATAINVPTCASCACRLGLFIEFDLAPEDHEALQKMISKVAFRLKGTGWYETDFKNKPAAAKADTEESPTKETASTKKDDSEKGSDKSDKPAAKDGESKKASAKTAD